MSSGDPWVSVADHFDPVPHPHLHNIAAWVHDTTGEHLWSKQLEVAAALATHRKVAVKAGHGVGKSWFAGRAVCHWLDVHPDGDAFAVTTAPTDPQVKAILWREIRVAHRRGGLRGRVSENAEWKNVHGDLVGLGRKPSDHNADAFQGLHARHLLAVLDEACGVPQQLWDAALSLTTTASSRLLAIGNPTNPAAHFAAVCAGAPTDGTSGMSRLGWWVITISAFDSPNLTGEFVPSDVAANLTGVDYIDEARLAWGEGSPLWVAKVEGQFPLDASDGVVPWSWLQACTVDDEVGGPLRVPVELGVDVGASDNGDESVIVCREGAHVSARVWRVRTADSEVVVDETLAAIRMTGATSVKVDAIGAGHGVAGSLRRRAATEIGWPVAVHAVMVSAAAPEPERFVNLRAWLWWGIARVYSQQRAWDLSAFAASEERVLLELSEPRYLERNGRVQIEGKDEIRKRLGRSPDSADALLLAFYVPLDTVPVAVSVAKYQDLRLRGRR